MENSDRKKFHDELKGVLKKYGVDRYLFAGKHEEEVALAVVGSNLELLNLVCTMIKDNPNRLVVFGAAVEEMSRHLKGDVKPGRSNNLME